MTCVPLVALKAAAGAFGDPQHVEDGEFEWVAVEARRRLRPGMFVAQVVGKSMEPAIPDGAFCLFSAPVTSTRAGKTVLVQLRNAVDPETGHQYTVKPCWHCKCAKPRLSAPPGLRWVQPVRRRAVVVGPAWSQAA